MCTKAFEHLGWTEHAGQGITRDSPAPQVARSPHGSATASPSCAGPAGRRDSGAESCCLHLIRDLRNTKIRCSSPLQGGKLSVFPFPVSCRQSDRKVSVPFPPRRRYRPRPTVRPGQAQTQRPASSVRPLPGSPPMGDGPIGEPRRLHPEHRPGPEPHVVVVQWPPRIGWSATIVAAASRGGDSPARAMSQAVRTRTARAGHPGVFYGVVRSRPDIGAVRSSGKGTSGRTANMRRPVWLPAR